MNTTMTPAQLAAHDQAQAKEREFDRKAATIAIFFLWLAFSLGVYCYLGLRGDVPLPSWSPAGQAQRQHPDNPVKSPPSHPPAPSRGNVEV